MNRSVLLIFFYCFISNIWGMELVLLKKDLEQVPLVYYPFCSTKKCHSMRVIIDREDRKYKENDHCLHKILHEIALLPKELRKKIVEYMFIENEFETVNNKATKLFLKTPFLYAITFYQQDKQLLENNIFLLKKPPISDLFCMCSSDKRAIINTIQSQHVTSLVYDMPVYTQEQFDDIKELDKERLEMFFTEREVMVIADESGWRKHAHWIPCILTGLWLASTALVAIVKCSMQDHCSQDVLIPCGISAVCSSVLGGTSSGIIYATVVKKNIRREVF